MQKADRSVGKLLAPELGRRWNLTEQALRQLHMDGRRVNAGVNRLVEETVQEQWYQYTRLELKLDSSDDGPAFFPSVETDRNASAAASRYFVHNSSADLLEGLLVHDDAELLAEAVTTGDAIRGVIVHVSDDAPPHTGRGRAPTRPVWLIRDEADLIDSGRGRKCASSEWRGRTGRIREFRAPMMALSRLRSRSRVEMPRVVDLPSPHDRSPNDPSLVGCNSDL